MMADRIGGPRKEGPYPVRYFPQNHFQVLAYPDHLGVPVFLSWE